MVDSTICTPTPRGSVCCARFSEDGGWYRAVVASVSPEGVTVCYVDYGNSETVDPSQVFVSTMDNVHRMSTAVCVPY